MSSSITPCIYHLDGVTTTVLAMPSLGTLAQSVMGVGMDTNWDVGPHLDNAGLKVDDPTPDTTIDHVEACAAPNLVSCCMPTCG